MKLENALDIIEKLKKESYKAPTSYYDQKKVNFEYQSYKYSAINEILFYLMEHNDENPIKAIEDFRYQMDCFACESKNGDANFMFSTYYDVATDVLDTLLGVM